MRMTIVVLVFVFAALKGVGQDTTFHLTIGTAGVEEAVDLFETNDGVILFGNTGNTVNGQSDIYILNLSSYFTLIDSKRYGTAGIEKLTSVSRLNNGNYVLASYSYSGYSTSDYDIRLDVADSLGNIFKTQILEKPGVQTPLDLSANEQTVFLLARTEGASLADMFEVLTFDYELNEGESFGIVLDDSFALNAMELQDNSIWIVGEVIPEDSTFSDVLILKLSFSGNILLQKNYGGSKSDYASSILIDGDSTILITGSTASFDSQDFDSYVLSLDTSSNLIWQEPFGYNPFVQNYNDFGVKSIKTFSGKYINGVSTRTYGEGEEDFHLYQISDTGAYESGNSYGLMGIESLRSIMQGRDSNYYLFGTTNTGGNGLTDLFLVKTPTASPGPIKMYSTLEDSTDVIEYSLALSPVNDLSGIGYLIYNDLRPSIVINSGSNNLDLWVYNVQGKLVRKEVVTDSVVDFLGLNAGVYIVKIGYGDHLVQCFKIITPTP